MMIFIEFLEIENSNKQLQRSSTQNTSIQFALRTEVVKKKIMTAQFKDPFIKFLIIFYVYICYDFI